MNNDQLADLYIELAMKFEEENYVECGFKAATEQRQKLIEKIRSGRVNKKDLKLLEPVFSYGNIDIHQHLSVRKRFFFF